MKRVGGNSQQSGAVGEEERQSEHELRLQKYLGRQKEVVAKKKKLQAAMQKRDVLLAEIRFLRRRYSHLLKIKTAETEPEVRNQNSDMQPKKIARKRKVDGSEAVLDKPSRVLPKGEEIVREGTIVEKKAKNCLTSDKKVGKKKISLQDQVALNV